MKLQVVFSFFHSMSDDLLQRKSLSLYSLVCGISDSKLLIKNYVRVVAGAELEASCSR